LSSQEASSVTADDIAIETAHVETVQEAQELNEHAEADAKMALDDSVVTEHDSGIVEDAFAEPSVDEAALETASVETAEDVKEVAQEANLTQEPVQPEKHSQPPVEDGPEEHDEPDEPEQSEPEQAESEHDVPLESVDEVALESANVETADEAAELAKDAGLAQTPMEPEIVEPQSKQADTAEINDTLEEQPEPQPEPQQSSEAEEETPPVDDVQPADAESGMVPVEAHETQDTAHQVKAPGEAVKATTEEQLDVNDLVHATQKLDLSKTTEPADVEHES
jgi:hypothetical protein